MWFVTSLGTLVWDQVTPPAQWLSSLRGANTGVTERSSSLEVRVDLPLTMGCCGGLWELRELGMAGPLADRTQEVAASAVISFSWCLSILRIGSHLLCISPRGRNAS